MNTEELSNNQHSWSAREEWWLGSTWHRFFVRQRVSRFLELCPEPFRGEVLEVGAGKGWTSRRILEIYPQVELTATDINEKSVEAFRDMRKQYGRRLYVKKADVRKLPFDRSSFDIVIADHVLHYVQDYNQALQQLLRVLRPGGLLGIIGSERLGGASMSRWLWPSAGKLPRAELLSDLTQESCTILADKKRGPEYYLWVRKSYPVETEEERSGRA